MSKHAPGGVSKQALGVLRWRIALVLGLGIIVSFFDRVNVSVTEESIKATFGLSDPTMGYLLSSYLWVYALLQIPVGALLDRVGIKWLMRGGTLLWAAATFVTAMASGTTMLFGSRVLLGVAESPIFPGSAKGISLWFPLRERGLATTCFDAAAKFSNVIGLPLVAYVVYAGGGWRAAFWFTGVLTLLYSAVFWAFYRNPSEHPGLTAAERAYILEGGAVAESSPPIDTLVAVRHLLRQAKMWGLAMGFGAYGYVFYLFLSWLPGYLERDLHMTSLKGGPYLAIPWLVGTITDVAIGGWLVDHLIGRGWDGTTVRKSLFVTGMLIGLAVLGAAYTTNPNWAVCWISISLGGLAFAAPIGWTLPGLIAPRGMVGTVGGIMNFSCNVFGILAPIVTGYIIGTTHSFAEAFIVATVVLALGTACFLALLGRIEPMPEYPASS